MDGVSDQKANEVPIFEVTSPDGKTYEITAPEGATQEQALAYAKQQLSQTPKEPPSQDFMRRAAISQARGENPFFTKVAEAAAGASGLMRGTANIVGGLFGQDKFGERIWPTEGLDKSSAAYIAGSIVDPVALGVGGGILKALPYAKVLGGGVSGAAKAAAKNLGAGATMGGTIGALSDDSSIGSGATIGAVGNVILPPAVSAATRAAGAIWDALVGRYGQVAAGKIARAAANGDLNAIRASVAVAPSDLTATQASAVRNDVWDALGELASGRDQINYFSRLLERQKQERIDTLRQIAGGATQTEARAVADASKKNLNMVTEGMRSQELAAANTGGQVGRQLQARQEQLAGAASDAVEDVRRLSRAGQIAEDTGYSGRMRLDAEAPPIVGLPRAGGTYSYGKELSDLAEVMAQRRADDSLILGQAARFTQMQLDSLAAHGLKPIDTSRIISSLRSKLNDPSIAGQVMAEKVLTNVGRTIQKWTEKGGGIIAAEALYAIRKSAVNSEIERMLGNADPKVKQKYASALLTKVRPVIDDAIIDAGGTGWRDYLKTYATGMEQITEQKMGAKALEILEKQPAKFESLVAGNEPKVVEKVAGTEYDIAKVMRDKYPPMQSVAEELKRDRLIKEGAARGERGLIQLIKDHEFKWILPNWIDREIAVTNRVLAVAESHLTKSTLKALEEGMKSGRAASEMLNAMPTTDKLVVLKAFLPYIQAGTVSSSSDNQ